MNLIVFVDPVKAQYVGDMLSVARNHCYRARKGSTAQKYDLEAEVLLQQYNLLPKKLNDNGLQEITKKIDEKIKELTIDIENDKVRFCKDPVYFIEHCEDMIVSIKSLSLWTSLKNIIENRNKIESRHWMVWVAEVFDEFYDDMHKAILRGVRNQFNCTNSFVNLVTMKKLETYADMIDGGNFSYMHKEIKQAMEWVTKNKPEILTMTITKEIPKEATKEADVVSSPVANPSVANTSVTTTSA